MFRWLSTLRRCPSTTSPGSTSLTTCGTIWRWARSSRDGSSRYSCCWYFYLLFVLVYFLKFLRFSFYSCFGHCFSWGFDLHVVIVGFLLLLLLLLVLLLLLMFFLNFNWYFRSFWSYRRRSKLWSSHSRKPMDLLTLTIFQRYLFVLTIYQKYIHRYGLTYSYNLLNVYIQSYQKYMRRYWLMYTYNLLKVFLHTIYQKYTYTLHIHSIMNS